MTHLTLHAVKLSASPRAIYLDTNIITAFDKRRFPDLFSLLLRLRDSTHIAIPFSSIHVQELTEVDSPTKAESQLAFLSYLTDGVEVDIDIESDDRIIKNSSPNIIYARIQRGAFPGRGYLQEIMGQVPLPFAKAEQIARGVISRKINNENAQTIWECLDKLWYGEQRKDGLPYPNTIDETIQAVRAESPAWNLDFEVFARFNVLHLAGYWMDDKSIYSSGSSLRDALHAVAARTCDVFISNDNAFRKRLAAVYWRLGIPTRVYDVTDGYNYLQARFGSH